MYHSTLYLVGEDGSLVLSGVTSYGTGCGDEGEGKRENLTIIEIDIPEEVVHSLVGRSFGAIFSTLRKSRLEKAFLL